jgi:hypothetical protein
MLLPIEARAIAAYAAPTENLAPHAVDLVGGTSAATALDSDSGAVLVQTVDRLTKRNR